MKAGEIAVLTSCGAMFLLFLLLGIQQGQENADCRKAGRTPVKVERGYQCIKTSAKGSGAMGDDLKGGENNA